MTPLERAAAAVERLVGTHCERCEAQLAGDPAEIARAVLTAIREPSDAMKKANFDRWERGDDPDISERWAVMIDAALAEEG